MATQVCHGQTVGVYSDGQCAIVTMFSVRELSEGTLYLCMSQDTFLEEQL